MILQGQISGEQHLQGGMNPDETLNGGMSGVILPPHYEGAYYAIPSTVVQTLGTKGKILDNDITVHALSLKPIVLRPDATLVQSYKYDKYIYEDEGVDIPAYTTTATTLKASANLSPTLTIDTNTETFFIVERFLTIPTYNVQTKGKGRPEYTFCAYVYELTNIPESQISSIDKSKSIATVQNMVGTLSIYRLVYWSSASGLSVYASNGYGCYQTPTAPTTSGSTLTIKSPALAVRGSTSYFTSTFMNELDDIRYQFVIDVYKAPKENLGINGWITQTLVNNIITCVNSNSHKLT